MELVGQAVIAVVLGCAVLGALASLRNPNQGLGKEFLDGLHAIGFIFVPVAGIMASIPILQKLVRFLFSDLFGLVGADPAMAATAFIAVDMGGYHLARKLAESHESMMMALVTGCMMGATIVFSIPVGLSMLEKRDHKYMALGVLSGLLAIPIGIFLASVLALAFPPEMKVPKEPLQTLALTFPTIAKNLLP